MTVGLVIVSHSARLAEGVLELVAQMAPDVPMAAAGAGSGIYNTTRQVGAVLGSAAIAVLMESRLAAHLPGSAGASAEGASTGQLPAPLRDGFSTAMAQSMLLPAGVALIGFIAVLCYVAPRHLAPAARSPQATEAAAAPA